MKEQMPGLGTRLEEGFLGLLRVVILLVLTASLIASCYFALTGLLDTKAAPAEYKYGKFNGDKFVERSEEHTSELQSH